RTEEGPEESLTAEAEGGEASADKGDSSHHDEDAQVVRRQELGERATLDRCGLGGRLLLDGGLGQGNRGNAHQPLSAWKMDTTAGPRMTTNRAGKIMKTSGKSILIGAFCACASAAARRRLRISTARLRRIAPTETPSSCPCIMARVNDSTAGVGH